MQTKEKLGGHRASKKTNFIGDELLPANVNNATHIPADMCWRKIGDVADIIVATIAACRPLRSK